jgi:hypothetical protein
MTTSTPLSPLCVIEALRGDRSSRPAADTTSASGLRARLEDGIYEIIGQGDPTSPLVVRAASLRRSTHTTDLSMSPLARIRGVLVSQLLRLLCAGVRLDCAMDNAVDAWRCDVGTTDLLEQLDRLDDDERARLATDVTAHALALSRALGDVPSRWMPRSALRASQRLAGGRVILRDVIDLMVGTNGCAAASVALFDVTTSPLGEAAERTMRYHALIETLRSSVVPLRTSTFSTATGELWTRDVDHEMLRRSADDVLEVVAGMWIRK